jgi:protein gp37
LAISKESPDGKKSFCFTGKIKLLPEELGDPLTDRTPSRYFVNSMSDLFHIKVPDNFITAVFDVMEKAPWHQFQVLTKRPKRMAEFTQKRYADKEPPSHIWLGTSTENQEAFDERYPHLKNVIAAVRWLSCEPLLGEINFGDMAGIDWLVTGGESGSDRKMNKNWATSIRDQCQAAGVAFFFKQWGAFNEEGVKERKSKKDGLTPPTIDGVIYNYYPQPRISAPEIQVEATK